MVALASVFSATEKGALGNDVAHSRFPLAYREPYDHANDKYL
jgi:hypothetical protein